MNYLIKCNQIYDKEYKPKYRQFSFELDHFQKYSCEGIDNNHNIFVAVATGSGKTVPAEYAISKAFSENNKVVYISPIKALSNQKYKDFSEEIEPEKIGILTGDNKVNPNADLVIMTAEIFRNSLYRFKWNQDVEIDSYLFDPSKVKYVILDEIHYINDYDRGKVWEEILMLLPHDTHLTMLSATIDKPEILASWVGNHQKKYTRLITSYKRPVPLKFYLLEKNNKILLMDEKWQDVELPKIKKYSPLYWINHSIELLEKEEKLPAIYFTLSKKKIDEYVNKITGNFLDKDEINQVKLIWNKYLLKYKKDFETSNQFEELYNLVIRGIGYHHSGIIPLLKEIIEILYSKKLIKVLLATETFAVGVNMPTKTVVFTGLSKFSNQGLRNLRTEEFLQMAGRAGRRGLDTFGEVIILPIHLPSEKEIKNILLGKPINLSSKLKLDYLWVLRNLYNLVNQENKMEKLIELAKDSFLERNTPENILGIKKQYEEISNKIKSLENNNLIDKTFYENYLLLENSLKVKQSKKKKKQIIFELQEIKKDKKFQYVKRYLELNENKNKLELDISSEEDKLKNQFEIIINYLEKEGMIKNNILTDFGLVSKEINEINPLVFGYLAFNNYLDNLSFDQLTAFLSIFLEQKENNTFMSDLDIDDNEKYILEKANEISNYYLDNEIKYLSNIPFPLYQDYSLTLENYQAVKLWAQGKPWKDLKGIYTNFEGNFVKLILRIHNLLREVKTIFSILKKNNLVEMIEENEDSLIREIVQTESLYLI